MAPVEEPSQVEADVPIMRFPLMVAVIMKGQAFGSRIETAVIETLEPVTVPVNVPVFVSVPQVPDKDDPDCVIVKPMT